jgi:hypothetical protein
MKGKTCGLNSDIVRLGGMIWELLTWRDGTCFVKGL